MMQLIEPEWAVDGRVRALSTTRIGGKSQAPLESFNVGLRSGDDPAAVAANRRRLRRMLPDDPCWLDQVHGDRVIHLDDWHDGISADAAWTDRRGQVAVVQTADCLPILLTDDRARVVAAIHAGWRGLAGGIVERTLDVLPVGGRSIRAWIGPSICGRCYQVGNEVRERFVGTDPALADCFVADADRWRVDLKAIARIGLQRAGAVVTDALRCTMCEPETFYSYRRDGRTGSLASLIWLG